MVKGVSRQVVVVKPPQSRLFEEVIFILKEDARRIEEGQILKEACTVANEYVTDPPRTLPKPVLFLLGAILPSIGWLLTALLQ